MWVKVTAWRLALIENVSEGHRLENWTEVDNVCQGHIKSLVLTDNVGQVHSWTLALADNVGQDHKLVISIGW